MGETGVRVVFGIVKKLVVPVFFGTSIIDKFVRKVFPVERNMVRATHSRY